MKDNELIRLILETIKESLPAYGLESLAVKQSYQPTAQGANTGNTAYLFKLFDKRYGFVEKLDFWDTAKQAMIHRESQWYETTFQISCLAIQNPANLYSLTSADIANKLCSIVQSDFALKSLRDKGVSVLRVTEVRNPYFVDDRETFESHSNFDFILTHEMVMETQSPTIETTEFNIARV